MYLSIQIWNTSVLNKFSDLKQSNILYLFSSAVTCRFYDIVTKELH